MEAEITNEELESSPREYNRGYGHFCQIVPEGEKGIAKVVHFEIGKREEIMSMISHHAGLTHVPQGKYVKLILNGHVVMSDTRMEYVTNIDVMGDANGEVLIAGLGLGFIIHPICRKKEVKSVLVIEKSQDVIDLILPHVSHEKLSVICADIHEWRPEKGRKFDTIYFDIWHDICGGNLPEVAKLHQRFKFFLNQQNPRKFMNSWSRGYLLAEKRSERSRYF